MVHRSRENDRVDGWFLAGLALRVIYGQPRNLPLDSDARVGHPFGELFVGHPCVDMCSACPQPSTKTA